MTTYQQLLATGRFQRFGEIVGVPPDLPGAGSGTARVGNALTTAGWTNLENALSQPAQLLGYVADDGYHAVRGGIVLGAGATGEDEARGPGLFEQAAAVVPGGLLTPAAAVGIAGAAILAGGTLLAARSIGRRRRGRRRPQQRRRASMGRRRRRASSSPRSRSRNLKRNRPGGAVRARYKGRRVHLTKRGQPYIILRSGKARFVRR